MNVENLSLPGVKLLQPDYFEDYRGYYCETYSSKTLKAFGIESVFVQDNHFLSLKRGTIRGIHFQNAPKAQAKLIRCTKGSLLDVVVDLRKDSPTYKRWISVILSAENRRQLYIPKGYGHGCISLEDETEGQYKVDEFYQPSLDRAIRWNSPELQIDWGTTEVILSAKDQSAPTLSESDVNFTVENTRQAYGIGTALVTGAGGFIGSNLVKELLSKGTPVIAVDRDAAFLRQRLGENNNLTILAAEFEEYGQLANKVNQPIDVFFHFAWQGVSGDGYRDIEVQNRNIHAACLAAQQADKMGVRRFVFAGSSHQFLKDRTSNGDWVNPSIYGAAKEAAHRLCGTILQGKMDYITVLFTNVFGVGDTSQRSTNTILKKLLLQQDVALIEGNHPHDWTYIDDAVGGIIAVAKRGRNNQSYYVGARQLKSFREILKEVHAALDTQGRLLFGAYQDTSFVDYSQINLESLFRDTGFECKENFRNAIQKTAAWLKAQENIDITENVSGGGYQVEQVNIYGVYPLPLDGERRTHHEC